MIGQFNTLLLAAGFALQAGVGLAAGSDVSANLNMLTIGGDSI